MKTTINPTAGALALRGAREAMDIASSAVSFSNDSIIPMLESIAALANFDGMDTVAIHDRMALIQKMAVIGVALANDMAYCMESEEQAMRTNLDALAGSAP